MMALLRGARRLATASLLSVCGAFALVQSAIADPVTVRHAQGETTLAAAPGKVFVFDLSALDALDALGVPVAGVPAGPKPERLKTYDSGKVAKVGTLFEPDLEAIAAAEPDLILIGGRSAPKYRDLERFAPTIDLTTNPKDMFGSAIENLETLGRIFGKQKEAASVAEEMRAAAAALSAKARTAGTALVVLTTGGRLSAYGPGSRFGVLYETFGFYPAAKALGGGPHGQPISYEFLLETNPDWLFVVDRDAAIGAGGEAAAAMLDNGIVQRTKAWMEKRVVYLNGPDWYLASGGPNSLLRAIRQIDAAVDGGS